MIGLLRSVRRRLIESESTRRYLLYAAGEVVPYDALKATGLDKVSNDRVRAALIETYDYRLPRTADFVAMSSAQFVGVDPLQDALFRPALENGPDRLPRITSILNADAGLLDATIPCWWTPGCRPRGVRVPGSSRCATPPTSCSRCSRRSCGCRAQRAWGRT